MNLTMLVAQERRDAVLAFAERKFAVPAGSTDENYLLEVVKAMVEVDS